MSGTYLITLESDQGPYTIRLDGSNAIEAGKQAAEIERAPLSAIINITKESQRMKEWKIQRPATLWIQATVKADSLWEALELWEKQFADGQTEEKDFEIDFDKYWAMDDTGREFDTAGEGETIA